MSIVASCTACQSEFRLRDDLGGKTIRCPNCQAPMAIPLAPASTPQRAAAPQPPLRSPASPVSAWSDTPARPAAAAPMAPAPAQLPSGSLPPDDFFTVPAAAVIPDLRASREPAPSTPRKREKPSGTPAWMIAAFALVVIVCVGALGALAVILVRVASKGDSPVDSWTADPARVANFTKELSIDRYVFKAPAAIEEQNMPSFLDGKLGEVRTQMKMWKLPGHVNSQSVLMATVSDNPTQLLESAPSNKEGLTALLDQQIENLPAFMNMSMKRSDVAEATIGGLPFVVVRLEMTTDSPIGGSQTGYSIVALHVEGSRTLTIMATTTDPPGSENYANLETILLTFQVRPGA